MTKTSQILFITFLVSGCGSKKLSSNQKIDLVSKQAEFELECKVVNVSFVPKNIARATGCNKKAKYFLRCGKGFRDFPAPRRESCSVIQLVVLPNGQGIQGGSK